MNKKNGGQRKIKSFVYKIILLINSVPFHFQHSQWNEIPPFLLFHVEKVVSLRPFFLTESYADWLMYWKQHIQADVLQIQLTK